MDSTPQLNASLAKAKTEFPKILENKKVKIPTKSGREISFAYAELEEIAEAVTPSLSEFGLTIVSQLSFVEDKFCLVTTLRHESGEAIASHFPLPYDPSSDPKDLGTKISYGRRYNTICLLEITTIEPSNTQQRNEQVRKLARDIKHEAVGRPDPIKKGDSSFLESFEPKKSSSSAAGFTTPENNTVIKTLLGTLKFEQKRFDNWFAQWRPGISADLLSPKEMSLVIRTICKAYAQDKQNIEASEAIDTVVVGQYNAGVAIADALNDWRSRYFQGG